MLAMIRKGEISKRNECCTNRIMIEFKPACIGLISLNELCNIYPLQARRLSSFHSETKNRSHRSRSATPPSIIPPIRHFPIAIPTTILTSIMIPDYTTSDPSGEIFPHSDLIFSLENACASSHLFFQSTRVSSEYFNFQNLMARSKISV